MPTFTIHTNQGDFDVEANRQPTAEEATKLIASQAQRKPVEKMGRMNPVTDMPMGLKPSGAAIDLALEAGLPGLAQAATVEFTPVGQSIAGGVASSVGNALAQIRRMAVGDQKGFNYGENAQATGLGAIPFAGPARLAAGESRGLLGGALQTAKTGAKMAGAGMAGEEVRSLVDDGQLASGGRLAAAGAIPMGITGATLPISFGGAKLMDYGNRVGQSLKAFGGSSIKPTPGMLLGGTAATVEQNMARRNPSGGTAKVIDDTYNQISSGLNAISPNPQEGAAVFKNVQPLIGQIRKSQDVINGLNVLSAKHQESVDQAMQKLNMAQRDGMMVNTKALQEELQASSDANFATKLSSITEKAKQIATADLVRGSSAVNPAEARDLFVKEVAQPMKKAFEDHSNTLYGAVGEDHGKQLVFETAPLISEAERLAAEVTGGLPKKLNAAIDMLKENLGDSGMASLDQLRFLRSEIRVYANRANASDSERRFVSKLGHSITEEINNQAETAFGADGGKALKYANKFYSETRPLLDNNGVSQLLEASPGDEYVTKVLLGMEKSGKDADEYKNLQDLILKINAFSPDVAAAAKGQVNSAIRGSLIHDASSINPNSPNGEVTVDGGALVSRLAKMARTPGTLETLGMGTPAKVAELAKLNAKYPDASKMSTQEWEQLFSSPTFSDLAKGGSLSSQLQPKMALSSAQNLVAKSAQLRAAGAVQQANETLARAKQALGEVSSDVSAAQLTHDALLKNPVAVAFDNPNLSDSSFNAFANTFFNPKANAVTNSEVGAMVSALKNSDSEANQKTLTKLQERYIADRIAAFKTSPATSKDTTRVDATEMSKFFNPANPGDASNEIERAKAILTPEQMGKLTKFAKVAQEVQQYEKLGKTPMLNASNDTPTVGMVRKGLDAAGDLYREGKYNAAAKLLADPEKFENNAIVAGTMLDSINSRGGQIAGLQIARYMLNNAQNPQDVQKAQAFLKWANRPK